LPTAHQASLRDRSSYRTSNAPDGEGSDTQATLYTDIGTYPGVRAHRRLTAHRALGSAVVHSLAYTQRALCLLTGPKLSELIDSRPEHPGKCRFFRIHCEYEKELLTDSKNRERSTSQLANLSQEQQGVEAVGNVKLPYSSVARYGNTCEAVQCFRRSALSGCR